jgi:DNA polymerase-3 subunit chi
MTEVLFYSHVDDRLKFAVRLVGKAYAQGRRVWIHVPDPARRQLLDDLLWRLSPLSFIPHCPAEHALAAQTPVLLGSNKPVSSQPADIMLQMDDTEPPGWFSRFVRVIEIVSQDPDEIRTARERFRFYRARGYPLENHNMAEKGTA